MNQHLQQQTPQDFDSVITDQVAGDFASTKIAWGEGNPELEQLAERGIEATKRSYQLGADEISDYVKALVGRLDDPSTSIRLHVASELAMLTGEQTALISDAERAKVLRTFIELLNGPDPNGPYDPLGPTLAVKTLISLNSRAARTSDEQETFVKRIGSDAKPLVEPVRKLLSNSASIPSNAIECLGEMGPLAVSCVDDIKKAVESAEDAETKKYLQELADVAIQKITK